MADRMKLGSCLLALPLLAACDSTSPASEQLLHVQGKVLEEGGVPTPPLDVTIQAWPVAASGDGNTATLRTDVAGLYRAGLGPFPDGGPDSLRVRVTQNDCGRQVTTELWRRDLALGGRDSIILPSLALSYRLFPAQLASGVGLCAAIVSPSSAQLVGDYARLALWIDEVSDSVRGRWRLNHSASIGDDYWYFSGVSEVDWAILQLRPTPPTPCTGLQLEVPVGGGNGATAGASELRGDGSCAVPSATVRFFDGAELPELLPPNVN